jgi:PPOX class probable F420-dependent enzyme
MIPAGFEDLLSGTAVAVVATAGADGRPQNNPVWFHWDGSHLRFGTLQGRQKYRNLRRDSAIALCIVDPQDSARYIEIRGRAIDFEDDADAHFARTVLQKYTGTDDAPWLQPDPGRVAVVVQPEHCTSMDGRAVTATTA